MPGCKGEWIRHPGVTLTDVAALIDFWDVDLIVTTGDNNYPNGQAQTIDHNIAHNGQVLLVTHGIITVFWQQQLWAVCMIAIGKCQFCIFMHELCKRFNSGYSMTC